MLPGSQPTLNRPERRSTWRLVSRPLSFFVGCLLGLAIFAYSSLVPTSSPAIGELGVQTAVSNGLRPQDFSAITVLLLKAIGLVIVGGLVVEAISNRLFGGTGGSKS